MNPATKREGIFTQRKTIGPIKSLEELHRVERRLRDEYSSCSLLFRGQTHLHEHVRSGRARPNAQIQPDIEAGWSAMATRMLGLRVNWSHRGLVKAILQHYGYATHYVDLTSNIEVAAWFASHQFTKEAINYIGSTLRHFEAATYSRRSEIGYILVLAIENPDDLKQRDRLFDLSELPPSFLRPHRQHGWLMLDRPPTLPQPDEYWIATITLDGPLSEDATTGKLFPPVSEDAAFSALLSLPFVQVPLGYFRDPDSKEEDKDCEEWCLAKRALAVPEYCEHEEHGALNHKWSDVTLFEPHPIRMWRHWKFDLNKIYPGIEGNIGSTVKISISPNARRVLESATGIECAWPSLGADGIFFSFAELDHDKVIDHGPPYGGVWLQRNDDLIVEVPMESDGKELRVAPGHGFFLRNGCLSIQETPHGCRCGSPESHEQRVASVLRLSSLLRSGEVILLPHPALGDFWYILITGNEHTMLQPQIAETRAFMHTFVSELAKAKHPMGKKPSKKRRRKGTPG